ncbi:hypothetical protein M0811_05068 [Anaeramoeba ignava]|uniref:H/ACA ribonucleoprotein complex subunit 2 n=1 Tax=Anaeramoeba ignava TaxID=1746090 RepID=A0A9Q0LT89_ANAIG|nr:hypothetical protein M0811_05068 [Anaeramoeba ignava]|eukprot:Anaeramoba_ignava/a15359_17.p1 GENE.a15359_17~~a15359_17.p1  ORF type:complete len:133 (-),score=44.52 a15359_17:57-455(-)
MADQLILPFANPFAGKKLSRRLLRVVKRGRKQNLLRRGVKEVQKAILKGSQGICIIAADVTPLDVVSHLPVLCEEHGVTYVFVPSKSELGSASKTRRSTSCVLISPNEPNQIKRYEQCLTEIKAITPKEIAN